MPGPYSGALADGVNEFDYDGTHYQSGDAFGPFTACQALGFLNAVTAANPDKGFTQEQRQVIDQLTAECPTTPNDAEPQPGVVTIPGETNPSTTGGDSGTQQGAPTPPVAGTVGGSQTGTGSGGGTDPNPPPTEEPTRPPDGEPHPTHGGEQPRQQTTGADPVDIFNGAFYLQETDLIIPNTILPLSFTRFYRSGAPSFGPLGWNWDHNFNLFIRELNTGDIALWRNLHEDLFKFDGINFEPPRGVFEKLERVTGIPLAFEIKAEAGLTMHFERPPGWIDAERIPITWIKDRHGNQLIFTYGDEDKLIEVRDDDHRFFQFNYDKCGLLVSVIDHAAREFNYWHDEQTMQLTCTQSPATTDHPDGITRVYQYEQPWTLPQLRHNIIRVEDSQGNVYLENTYEQDPSSWSYARVIEQLYGGFLFQFRYTQLQWVPANAVYINIPAVRVETMNPDFGLETYTFNYRGDLLDRRYRLSKDKSYRVVVWQYEFDEQGNPSVITKPDGAQEISTYDAANPDPRMRGKLVQRELTSASGFPSPSRIVWKGKYEPLYQQITEEKNELNSVTTYKYDFNLTPAATTNTGKLKEIIFPDATLPDGTIQHSKYRFEYNSKGQRTAVIQPDGTRNEVVYGNAGNEKSRIIQQTFDTGGLGIQHKTTYDVFGFNRELIDGNGNSSMQFYNALGLLEKYTLPAIGGASTEYRFHYNSDKRVIATEKPKGEFTDPIITGDKIIDEFQRDVLGYPTKYTLSSNTAEKRILNTSNDFRGFPVESINPDGSIIRKTFDERGLPLTEEVIGTDGKKITSKKVYDRSGKIIQEINPFGLKTFYAYDGFSRISKVTLPNGTEIRNQWLKGDLLKSEETIGDDGTGVTRQLSMKVYTYDEKARRVTETIKAFTTDPAVATDITTSYFYDAVDRLEKKVNNRGGISSKQYDGLGRVITAFDPMGNEEHYTYDNNGNVIQTESHHTEPDGSVSIIIKQFGYDARNRRIEIIEPDGARVTSEYDDRNLLVRQTDYSGIIKETFFNSFNDKIREVNDAGGLNITHQWSVDNMSRVTAYSDPSGQVSNYLIDTIGRNYKIEYANGFTSTKYFNTASQIIKEELGSGVEFEYVYDAANRISQIKNTATPAPIQGVGTYEFFYDGLDRVLLAKAGTESIARRYDSLGRLLSENTLGSTISCNYDDALGTVEKTWPDGRKEKLSHNLNDILVSVEETANGSLGSGNSFIASFIPSGANTFGEAAYQSGITLTNTYDERKRLTELLVNSPAGTNENIKYRYDASNTRRVEALLGQNPKTSYFEFDARYRLSVARDNFTSSVANAVNQAEHDLAIDAVRTAAMAAAHAEGFTYNPADARTLYSETGTPDKNYTFFPGHKIKSDGTHNYFHHIDGTLQSDGLFDYTVDALGRIIEIKSGATVITEIFYDAFGRPSIVKEAGKPDKSFNYFGGFIEQENENGIPSRQISLHPVTGVPIAYHSSLGTHYTLFDSRFNLIGLTDTGGNLVETYRYKSFGVPAIFDNAGIIITSSAFGVEPVFGGQKFLTVSGLYLSKRRLMNPVNGVFLSVDPKGYIDSASLYVYAAQNPVDNIDPNGEIIPFIVAAFVIGGAVAGAGYSAYDAYHNPSRYEGWQGSLRVLGNVFGGAAIGGVSILAGEAILAAGGIGIFASGTGATLTATQSFLLYGTSSAVSGSVLRGGFNSLFPEHIDPVTARSVTIDFVAGGAIGTTLRALTNYATGPGFGTFPSVPGSGRFANWFRFGADAGGSAAETGSLGPYPGRIGAWLDRIGIRQGTGSSVVNNDIGGNIFARVDTGVHEGFHAFVARYFPTFRNLSSTNSLGAIARYPEEVVAYALGHGAAGRVHGIPFAPFEAFNSLSGYDAIVPGSVRAAQIFWGRLTGAAGVGTAEHLFGEDPTQPNETVSSK